MGGKIDRAADFLPQFREDLKYWVKTDRKLALRTLELVEAVLGDPLNGIGKPEPLRHELAGCWSRRITQEHRLVYRITENRIYFLQARYHYE
jgi:toxin YoeB